MWLEIRGSISAIKFIRLIAAHFGEVSLNLRECKTIVDAYRFHEHGESVPKMTEYSAYDLTILARVMCGVHKSGNVERAFLTLVNGPNIRPGMLAALNRWFWETFLQDTEV